MQKFIIILFLFTISCKTNNDLQVVYQYHNLLNQKSSEAFDLIDVGVTIQKINVQMSKNKYTDELKNGYLLGVSKIIDTIFKIKDTVVVHSSSTSVISRVIKSKHKSQVKYLVNKGKISYIKIYYSELDLKNNLRWDYFLNWILLNSRDFSQINEKLLIGDTTCKIKLEKLYEIYLKDTTQSKKHFPIVIDTLNY